MLPASAFPPGSGGGAITPAPGKAASGREPLAATGAAAANHGAAATGGHAGAETMTALADEPRGLKGAFHRSISPNGRPGRRSSNKNHARPTASSGADEASRRSMQNLSSGLYVQTPPPSTTTAPTKAPTCDSFSAMTGQKVRMGPDPQDHCAANEAKEAASGRSPDHDDMKCANGVWSGWGCHYGESVLFQQQAMTAREYPEGIFEDHCAADGTKEAVRMVSPIPTIPQKTKRAPAPGGAGALLLA